MSVILRGAAVLLVLAWAPHPTGLKFYWAAQVARGESAALEFARVDEKVTLLRLHTGDRLQFYFSAGVQCHVYLLNQSPDESLRLLFPEPSDLAAPLKAGAQRYLPGRNTWFNLDEHLGLERIYLIVSVERLEGLERLLKAHADAGDAERRAAREAVIGEIARLRKAHAQPEVPAPKLMPMVGRFRASAPDLASVANEVTAATLHARTYFLEHR